MSQFPPPVPRSRRLACATTVSALLLLAAPVAAQEAPAPAPTLAATAASDTGFARAQRLVSEGSGAAGRALVDSLLAAAPAGSLQAAEALFWRASLAATSAEAERDYRRLAVEFPLSPRSEDALLRLAQLELTRGDRAQAVKHLERLALEHPTGASRPRASYWMARIKFEQGDAAGACAAIAGARASAPPGDVELRNQIEYTARRCARVEAARADSAPADAAGATTAAGTPATRGTTAPASAPAGTAAPAAPGAAAPPPASSGAARPAASEGTERRTFAVQVAAFDTRRAADAMASRLSASGHAARVDGSAAPFRVRVGRYRTREEAVALQRELARRRINGFVVAEGGAR